MDLRSKDAIESSKQHDVDMDNILIAEFMGLTNHHNDSSVMLRKVSHNNEPPINEVVPLKALQYDTSWDWLMPVVEKIESLGYEVQIRNTDCIIFQLLDTLDYKPVIGSISNASGKKDSTYIAVVRFIKEYNQLKQE